jgi:hypothetical protein
MPLATGRSLPSAATPARTRTQVSARTSQESRLSPIGRPRTFRVLARLLLAIGPEQKCSSVSSCVPQGTRSSALARPPLAREVELREARDVSGEVLREPATPSVGRALSTSGGRNLHGGFRAKTRRPSPPLRHAQSFLAARGGQLHSPDAAQAEPREADWTSDAALLLSQGIGLLVRHDLDRQGQPGRAVAFA